MLLLLVAVMSLSAGGIFVHLLLDVMGMAINPNSSLEQFKAPQYSICMNSGSNNYIIGRLSLL